MLRLKNICKSYNVGKSKNIILDNITLDFKMGELVFILGASGSGKSTLLNIIGGNLKCDSGEIWLDNICINQLSNNELNDYHSNVIGNIFQDYNLIEYMSVIDNIRLAFNRYENKERIDILLKQLGIYDKKKMIVSKLSGGEKQRVAIVRALVNNPDIILADEPTGALDSKNSIEVMEILKKVAQNKLVIVVSHDNYLANKYASRIINIKDGKCEYLPILNNDNIVSSIKKRKSKYLSIIKLAIKNLWLKKIRTFFTALAISFGIISMFIVGNLYYNFNDEIKKIEQSVVSVFPISISNGEFEILDNKARNSSNKIILKDRKKWIHTNNINKEYIDYLDKIDEIKYITYNYDIFLPFISDKYNMIDNTYLMTFPSKKYVDDNFDLIYGKNITNKNELLIKVDSNNNVDSRLLNYFDINSDIEYSDIVGRKIKVILNDQYYNKNGDYYVINDSLENMFNSSNIELEIVGIIKEKNIVNENNYIYYDNDLLNEILEINRNSEIVKSQLMNNYNVLGLNIDKKDMLSYLGYNSLPNSINIYVDNLLDKDKVIKLLDRYNKENDKLIYVDTMSSAIDIVRNFINIISVILVLFSVICVIISSLMIAILTNIRVLERKKEVGIFRSLGASKRDIKRLFNTENIIIGIVSLIISYIIIILMVNPVNTILNNYLDMENVFKINYIIVLVIFLINLFIIKLAGKIPVNKASRLDIVNCIYNR